jgi:uncharacterized protein YtpQ (UPF0354 family)
MFGLFKKQPVPQEPNRDVIVPRLKHLNFLSVYDQMGAAAEDRPVTEPFAADLLVTYAFDLPEMFQMVSVRDCNELELSPGELRAIALTNLRKQLPSVQVEGQPPIYMAKVGNDLEACLLLLDEVWTDISSQLPGEIVAAVPSRDMLLFTSNEWQDVVSELRALASETVQKFPDAHNLTQSLLIRRGEKWQEL